MGKSYLRYRLESTTGVIVSPECNPVFASKNLAITGALENIHLWNITHGVRVRTLAYPHNGDHTTALPSVTQLKLSSKGILAAGYFDGSIRLWELKSGKLLHTLNGHRRMISTLEFTECGTTLASGSADTDIIIWDVVAAMGKFRLSDHSDRITSLAFVEGKLISSSKDGLLKLWDLTARFCVDTAVGHKSEIWVLTVTESGLVISGGGDETLLLWRVEGDILKRIGDHGRTSTRRGMSMTISTEGKVYLQTVGYQVEVYSVKEDNLVTEKALGWRSEKLKGFATHASRGLVEYQGNSFAVVDLDDGEIQVTIEREGHRTGVRAVEMSQDDTQVISCGGDGAKIWNIDTGKTLRSFYGLGELVCISWIPGCTHFVAGNKNGELLLCHVASGNILSRVKAHAGLVSSLHVHPRNRSIVTGGGDDEVKIWEIEGTLLEHKRTLKMQDDTVCVRWSDECLAVASLDSQVRVFFTDSLKLKVNLYGHKLPIISMDFSDDGRLLSTGSSDKTVKVWGVDFGDCHRSFGVAHDATVTSIRFVNGTHYFFSAGKDGRIHYWDADKLQKIHTLNPDHGTEVWGLTVGYGGTTLVSCGVSKAIRVWAETPEMVFLDHERQKELENYLETEAAIRDADVLTGGLENGPGVIEGSGVQTDIAKPVKATLDSMKGTERLMESLDLVKLELSRPDAAENPNPLLLGKDPDAYLVFCINRIPRPDLQMTLILLPFDYAVALLEKLTHLISLNLEVELCVRCQLYLIEAHYQQLTSDSSSEKLLINMKTTSRKRLRAQKDVIGFNIAALKYLKSELTNNKFDDDSSDRVRHVAVQTVNLE